MMMKLPHLPKVSIWGGVPIACYGSETFYAAVFHDQDAIRIDVVRLDLKDGIKWDELQQLKSELGYGDDDAIEFYPRDADLFNTGNVRHLFVVKGRPALIRRSA